jgi:hypothetical protein
MMNTSIWFALARTARSVRELELVSVNCGMTADIQQSYVPIIAPFCEDNPQIVINDYRPFSAHLACQGMIT